MQTLLFIIAGVVMVLLAYLGVVLGRWLFGRKNL
jgi:hypothetical protein